MRSFASVSSTTSARRSIVPGEEVEKAGAYIIHRDFDTSRQINQYLADRQDTEFFVQADGALWRIVVDYR